MEVTAALSSSASVSVNAMMKEKLKRLQLFLADFEVNLQNTFSDLDLTLVIRRSITSLLSDRNSMLRTGLF